MKSITKDKQNSFQKFKYASLSSIWADLTPVLNDNQLLVDVQVTKLENVEPYLSEKIIKEKNGATEELNTFQYWVRAKLTLIDVETSEKDERFYDFLNDVQQANDVQKSGSTMTYAQRYALSAYFGIAYDEDDPDHSNNTPKRYRDVAPEAPRAQPAKAQSAPAKPVADAPNLIDSTESAELYQLALSAGISTREAQMKLLSEFGYDSWRTITLEKAPLVRAKLIDTFNFGKEQ
jgi:hypothetical protein